MFCLGISGGLNRVHEDRAYSFPPALGHDGAAALFENGRLVAAIEEERLNRIKHSNKFPVRAIRHCLDSAGIALGDVERIGFFLTESYCDALLANMAEWGGNMNRDRGSAQAMRLVEGIDLSAPLLAGPVRGTGGKRPGGRASSTSGIRSVVGGLLEREFAAPVDHNRITFVRHHLAHAISAAAMSGFDESLVLVVDAFGDASSGMVARANGSAVTEIESFGSQHSIGYFYLNVCQFLGYSLFDEYKVMALAPFGDAATFRSVLRASYHPLPNGRYEIDHNRMAFALYKRLSVRKKADPISQEHKDLAAALQEALEDIVFHVVRWHREATGLRRLCFAGGVAHNCSLNGRLLNSGLFDEIFVQPAAHDAGCALGAGMLTSQEAGSAVPVARLRDVYLGSDIGPVDEVNAELARWSSMLTATHCQSIAETTAHLLAQGAVVGWVQGRSEFGPRALGNRSIVADPRPALNKERINLMVKKREEYRPFAPSVLEERAGEFFELPPGANRLPFMTFVMKVRPERRAELGAITHVDGTARLQTVAKADNPRYWELIDCFGKLTGVPIVLNTSFNNNVEPIVETVEDAMVSFLTTELDYLVVGDYLVSKRALPVEAWLTAHLSLPPYVRLFQTRAVGESGHMETIFEVGTSSGRAGRVAVSGDVWHCLNGSVGQPIGLTLADHLVPAERQQACAAELLELWSKRLVCLRPYSACPPVLETPAPVETVPQPAVSS